MLTKFESPTLSEIIADHLERERKKLSIGLRRGNLLRDFRQCEEQARTAAQELQRMTQRLGVRRHWDIEPELFSAEFGALEHDEAVELVSQNQKQLVSEIDKNFVQDLGEAAAANYVGEIEWLSSNACRLSFFERQKTRGVWEHETKVTQHIHDLIDAK